VTFTLDEMLRGHNRSSNGVLKVHLDFSSHLFVCLGNVVLSAVLF